jgi:hypothetical protein
MNGLQARVTGTLLADGTLRLDEKPDLPPGRVRIVLHREEPEPTAAPSLLTTLDDIHRDQQARGFQGLDQATLDARLQGLRDEPDDEAKGRQIQSQTRTASSTEAPS